MFEVNDMVTMQGFSARIVHLYPETRIAPYEMARIEYCATGKYETVPLDSLRLYSARPAGMFDALTITEAIELETRLNHAHAATVNAITEAKEHAGCVYCFPHPIDAMVEIGQLSGMLSDQTQAMIDLRNRRIA